MEAPTHFDPDFYTQVLRRSRWSDRGKSGPKVGVERVGFTPSDVYERLRTLPFRFVRIPKTMDPVAAKSSFLCMYMSNHKDTLASYVIYHGKVANTRITNAEMCGIDSHVRVHYRASHRPITSYFSSTQGMDISYRTPSSGDRKMNIKIKFEPPLSGYEEVKPRLLSMKAEAEEALGMVGQRLQFESNYTIYIIF